MKYIKNLKNLSNVHNKLQFVNKQKICYENINNDEFNKYKSLWESKYSSKKQENIHEKNIDLHDPKYSEIFWEKFYNKKK